MKIPPRFKFQDTALEWLFDTPRALLRMDTGLGKTRVCSDLIIEERHDTLIIAPAFLKQHWKRELKKWGFRWNCSLVIVSYEYASKWADVLKRSDFHTVIIDEAHYLRNWTANRTREIILKILKGRKRIILATATPVVKSASDLHPLFSILAPGKWGKYKKFCKRYCIAKPDMWSRSNRPRWTGVRKKYAAELERRSAPFVLTMRKTDVQKDLPKKTITEIDLFDSSIPAITDEFDPSTFYEPENVETRRSIGLAKVPDVLEWAENIDENQQVVIFVHHQEVGEEYESALDNSALVTGRIPPKKRQRWFDRFQLGKIRYLICSIDACGVGISLTAASIIGIAELPWTYTQLKQCSDRVVRTGQTKPVNEYRFIMRGTLDDAIMRSIKRSIDTAEHTVGHIF